MKVWLTIGVCLIVVSGLGCGQNAKEPPSTTSTTSTTTTTTTVTTTTATTTTTTTTTTTLPPARISGTVYYRDPNTSYSLNAIGSGISGAVVTVASVTSDSTATDSSGNYSFADISPGFHSVTAEKSGYITTKVSSDLATDKDHTINLGLYDAPTVSARSSFIKGFALWDAGGWLLDFYYANNLFQSTYTNIKDKTGANLVGFSDPIFVISVGWSTATMSTESHSGSFWRMLNESEYQVLVNDAHSKGMAYMMHLGVMADDQETQLDGKSYGEIIRASGSREAAFWDAWFSEYKKYLKQYAEIAERLGIEYLAIGHNLDYATGKSRFANEADCLNRWKGVIYAITAEAGYTGKIVYFGGTNPITGSYDDGDYASGFVELFDYIGVSMGALFDSSSKNPSLSQIKSAVQAFLNRYAPGGTNPFNRPIILLIGTPSVNTGTSTSEFIEPLVDVNPIANNYNLNLYEQADMYEAVFEVVNGTPTGAGRVMGIYSWGYNYFDDYFRGRDSATDMAMDKASNIRGKPAEAICKFWFDRL